MFEHALPTKDVALDIASTLHHFILEAITDHYIKVIVLDENGQEQTFLVRPLLEQTFLPMADDGQLVMCIERDGRRIDILLPPANKRSSQHAMVLPGKNLPVQSH